MKRAALLVFTAILGSAGVGCGPTNTTADVPSTNDSGTIADSGVMTDTGSIDAGGSDVPTRCPPDAGAGSSGGYYLPPGCFTLTPFLSPDNSEHLFDLPAMMLEAGKDYAAVIETTTTEDADAGPVTTGRIVLDLTETQTPITVNSFVFLARNHYYDGILFHRVIEGFMAQTGDPNTLEPVRAVWGQGGPGYSFGTETVTSLRFDGPGVLGMARAASRDSNGSQFFITFAAATSLNGNYTVFGRVIEGMETMAMIHRGEPPLLPTMMSRVYIVERPR